MIQPPRTGADGRRGDDGDGIKREGRSALLRREGVDQDGLFHRREAAAADALQDASQEHDAQARRDAAEERSDGEQRDAAQVVVLAAEDPAEPRRHRQHHRIGHQVRRQDPGHLVEAAAQSAGDVGQGTLAIEVSSSSMKVARVTVSAIAQGFTPGFTAVVCAVPVVCVAANHSPSSGWEVDLREETDRNQNGSIIFTVAAKQTPRSDRIEVRSSRKGDQTRQHIIAQSHPCSTRRATRMLLQEDDGGSGGRKVVYTGKFQQGESASAAFDFAWAEVSHGRTRGLEEIEDPLLRIAAFIRNFAERKPALRGGCPLLNTAIDADDGNPALRALAREALEGWRTRLRSLISLAVRQGKLQDWLLLMPLRCSLSARSKEPYCEPAGRGPNRAEDRSRSPYFAYRESSHPEASNQCEGPKRAASGMQRSDEVVVTSE